VLKAAHDAEEFYEDRGARISILAGRRPPRPDTLKQTDQPPISTKPLADGAGHTLQTGRAIRFQQYRPRVVIHDGNKIQEISHGEGSLRWRHRREIWLPRPGSSLFN
jgi:hypothetical protein